MKASKQNPIYTAFVISGGTKYDVNPALLGISLSDEDKQIAQSATIQLASVKVGDSTLADLIKPRSRVYIYADDGEKNDEVFRGFVWKRPRKNALEESAFDLRCYDNLIYLQESDDSAYFSAGKSTKDVFTSLCSKWGIKLSYTYRNVTHSKLVLRGKLADIFIADLLDPVKQRTGQKYTVLSEKDVLHVKNVGSNSTIYHFIEKQNVTEASDEFTMDGMVTKVVILGKADSEGKEPVEAVVSGNTAMYGTIQKIIDRDEDTTLADAKHEAQSIIEDDGAPKWTYELRAVNVPWIRKGDKVYVKAGGIVGYFIVTSVERTISKDKNEMTLSLEDV